MRDLGTLGRVYSAAPWYQRYKAQQNGAVMAAAITAAYRPILGALLHTITLDNDKEFTRFRDIEKGTVLAVYFANLYSARQRGTNENTNGLLQKYFPKGSDFRSVTPEKHTATVKILNHRLRKCLGYRTPHQIFLVAKLGAVGK